MRYGQALGRVVASREAGQWFDLAALVAHGDAERRVAFAEAARTPLDALAAGRPFADLVTELLGHADAKNAEVAGAEKALSAPIPRPNRILAIGRNYADHAKELGNAVPDDPIVFMKASTCVVGPNEAIEIAEGVGRVDFEGELLVVLGSGGKHITEADAMRHVAGYTLFNDVTARTMQRAAQEKKQPWFVAKSLDTFGPLGPYLVSADEISDPHALPLVTRVNGEIKQDGSTGDMIYRIPFLIAYLSRYFRLEAGDVIATGTPSGVGPLEPGDTVSVAIDGLGMLSNPVIAA